MLEHSWRAEYERHEVRIENHVTCERLYLDSRLVDERHGLLPPTRPLAAEITSEAGTISVVHVYVGYRTVSSDCLVMVYRRLAGGDVIDEPIPVETEKDAGLFAKVCWSLWIGLLLLELPEGIRNMIRAGAPIGQIAFRVVSGAVIWLLLGLGFIRLMSKLDERRPALRPARTEPDKREDPEGELQQAAGTAAQEKLDPFESWLVRKAADGTLWVQRGGSWYLPRVIVCSVFTLLAAGLIAGVLFLPSGPGKDQEVGRRWPIGLSFLGFAFLYFLFLSLRYALEREEWHVGPNFLEVRKRFLHWRWDRRYTNATLTITSREPVLQLMIEMGGRKRLLAFSSMSGPAAENPTELHALATLLTTHTGWPPPYLCPACGGVGRVLSTNEPCLTCDGRGRVTGEELADWIRRRAVEQNERG